MMPSKVFLTSTGCFIVQTETNHIAAYLNSNHYEIVDSIEKAEAIIITTCAVTEKSAEGTYQGIFECIKKRNNHVPIFVVGCYPRIERKRMEELLGYGNIHSVPEINDIENEFLGSNPWNSVTYNDFYEHPFSREYLQQVIDCAPTKVKFLRKLIGYFDEIFRTELLFHYLLAVGHLYNPEVQRAIWPVIASKGCTHACTYCAVRIGRGKYTSKPPDSIRREIRVGIDNGYKRMLLIGDELGPYGVDLKDGSSLSSLLDLINSEEFAVKFGLWYLDAFMLMEAAPALNRLAEKGKIFFLGITVQHGSERILDLMNRHYSIPDTMNVISNFRRYPGVMIATQFMVGFPTETEEDFLETFRLVEKGVFDKVEVFEFSPRPGTRAAKMIDDVPPQVKADRAQRLRKLAAKKSKRIFLNRMIGRF